MNLLELVQLLYDLDIGVFIDVNGELVAIGKNVTSEILDELRGHKQWLIDICEAKGAVDHADKARRFNGRA